MNDMIENPELAAWLLYHAVGLRHRCDAVKGADGQNTQWVDTVTGETCDVMVKREQP